MVKFNQLTFDIKDIILIVGIVMYVVRAENKQLEQYNELKSEIQQIISDNKIQEVKINARFDGMKHTSNGAKVPKDNIYFMTCFNNRRLMYDNRKKIQLFI